MKNQKEGKGHWLKRLFSRLALVLLLLVLFVFISSAVISYFFEDEVANAALRQVYKTVDTEVAHRQVSLSLWRKFPRISLKVDGLTVKVKNSNDLLLEAETVYLQLNLMRLLQNSFELQRLNVEHARLYLESYAKNRHNWDVFKENTDTSDTEIALALASVSFSDIDVYYVDDEALWSASGHVGRMTAKGKFKEERCDLKLSALLSVDTVRQDTQCLYSGGNVRLKGGTVIDLAAQQYELHELNLGVSRLNMVLDAVAKYVENDWQYQVKVAGKRLHADDLYAELPETVRQKISGYQIHGQLNLDLLLHGSTSTQSEVQLACQLEKGYFRPEESEVALESVSMNAVYQSQFPDWEAHSLLKISSFSAALESGRITGEAEASDLTRPHVRAQLQATIQLADLKEFLPKIALYQIGGKADVQLNMDQVFPSLEQLSLRNLKDAGLNGSMTLKNGLLQMDSNSFLWDGFSASLLFSGQTLQIVRFNGKVQGNKCELSGRVSPVYDFIFQDDCKLKVVGQVTAPMLNVDAFIPPVTAQSAPAKSSAPRAVKLPDFVEVDMQLKSDRLKYDRFEARKVEGSLKYKDAVLLLENLSLQAFSGNMLMQTRLCSLNSGDFELQSDVVTRQVDIQRLFYVLHDFGVTDENGLTHKNIQGKANADIKFAARMDSCLVLQPESIDCKADLTVSNGRLLNYKALEALSAFIKLEDLKDIRFETMKNSISVQKKCIYIPEMEVKNNLLNLILSGTQTFEGDLHYNVSLYLSELLSKKRKERVSSDEFGEVVEDGKYGVRLHLLVAGTVDDPQFKWNHKKANEGFRQSLRQQGDEFRELFKSEKREQTGTADTAQQKLSKRKKEERELNDSRKRQQELDVEDW